MKQKLLALGPGYAISPNFKGKNKENIIQEICDRIAEAAIAVRWNRYFSTTSSAATLHQHLKTVSPFDKKFTKPPPTDDVDLENRLIKFRDEVRQVVNNTTVKSNLTREQRELLFELKANRELHFSIADKTSEFVVMTSDMQRTATKLHFDDPAYKAVKMPNGEKKTTQFIKKLTESLETKINEKWKEICTKRNLGKKVYDLFAAYHTVLPTGRIQIKTHKHDAADISSILLERLKVRPIVSNCNSPMDKITFLLCHILTPLLDQVPSHLKNTYTALTKLQAVPQDELRGKQFFTADVESLYTNINVNTAILNIIEFATEHRSKLTLYGLTLTDIHELFEVSLLNSYFMYDRQVYIQLQGFFMGVRPAPLGAIIKMWKLESLSLYTDLRISMVYYGRFYDDLSSAAHNKRRAQLMCNLIEAEDPDQLIHLTLDYPPTKDDYTPFLNMERFSTNFYSCKGLATSNMVRI